MGLALLSYLGIGKAIGYWSEIINL